MHCTLDAGIKALTCAAYKHCFLLSAHFLAAIRIGAINNSIDNNLFSTHVKRLLAYIIGAYS